MTTFKCTTHEWPHSREQCQMSNTRDEAGPLNRDSICTLGNRVLEAGPVTVQ
jgi:hypothetical protein